MQMSETRTEIFKALSTLRKTIKQPLKSKDNPFFKSKYVTLEGIVDAIDTAIKENDLGLSYIQELTSEGNQATVTTHILHDSGEFLTLDPLNIPVSKNDAQAFGSAATYAKRYALGAAFGVTSEFDDDGDYATANNPKERPNNLATPKQVGMLKVKVMEYCSARNGNKEDLEDFLANQFKVQNIYESSKTATSNMIKYLTEKLEA